MGKELFNKQSIRDTEIKNRLRGIEDQLTRIEGKLDNQAKFNARMMAAIEKILDFYGKKASSVIQDLKRMIRQVKRL